MPSDRKSTLVGPIRSPEGQLAFPHLLLPETTGKFPSNKFITTFLIPLATSLTELINACVEAAKLEWPTLNITTASQIKLPIRKGTEKPGWEQFLFLKAKSKNKPPIVDARKAVWTGEPKGGDFCRLALTAMPYKQQIEPELAAALAAQGKVVQVGVIDGKSVSWRPATTFLLNGVQWLRAGQPVGGQGTVNGVGAFADEGPSTAAAAAGGEDLFN